MTPTFPRAAVLVALAATLAGCPRPLLPEPAASPASSPAPVDRLLASRIGTGDTFEVRVYQEPDLTGVYRVGADGTIDFPFCGRVAVTSLTSSQIAERLTACLAKGYLKSPQVTVTPKEISSKKVFVLGHVQKPGTFAYEDGMTIIQAITLAGGFAQFAKPNATNVTRLEGGEERRYTVPVEDIGTGQATNFYLQPGDIVFVPESVLF